MIRNILLASTAGLAGAMLFAAPAAAQNAACEVNGASTVAGAATGGDALACGFGSTASGIYSVAIGSSGTFTTTATQNGSVAVGVNSDSTGIGSTVIGTSSNALADGAIAVGSGTNATLANTVAVGTLATADDANSVALGANTNTSAANQVAVGGRTIGQVANGAVTATSTDAVTGQQLFATNTNVAANTAAISALAASTAENAYIAINSVGPGALATGTNAIAIGQSSVANGTDSIAIGNGASNGGFANSLALGAGLTNTAANQVRVGGTTTATARVVTGVAAGTISSTSLDAVNGTQLNATNSRVSALEAFQTTAAAEFERIEGRFEKMGDRMKAGTAVAIAMSGNGFLPDKKINVTGNLGFYSGAYAGALQVGSVLTDNIAFNAGVAKSFNRGGKMGARFGFTFGW